MSENTTPQYTTEHGNWGAPPPAKRPWYKRAAVLLPAGALLLGLGVGSAVQPKPETITKEVPGPERVVTKTETVEKTPVACLTALDLSEQAIDYAGEALGYTKEAMMAASRLDAAGITAESNKVGALTPKIKAITGPLTAAKAECRAAE
jgi:hypothetical protein